MNIIFGEAFDSIPNNYTVLELDTFVLPPDNTKVTSYCVIEKIALHEFPVLEAYKKVHADLIQAYRDRNWEYCEDAVRGLLGRWNGELDTFYDNLIQRVRQLKDNPPDDDWTGYIVKTIAQDV
jgi:hypothetical protein